MRKSGDNLKYDWASWPFAEALTGRAYELITAGDYGSALQALDTALALCPFQPRAWALKVLALTYGGRRDEALAAAVEAVRRDAASGHGYTARGAARMVSGEVADGAEDCEYGLGLTPAGPLANYFAAFSRAHQGNAERCRESLGRAVAATRALRNRARAEEAFAPFRDEHWFRELVGRH
jgi:tetratricopeptide (TPR) repeat protein